MYLIALQYSLKQGSISLNHGNITNSSYNTTSVTNDSTVSNTFITAQLISLGISTLSISIGLSTASTAMDLNKALRECHPLVTFLLFIFVIK